MRKVLLSVLVLIVVLLAAGLFYAGRLVASLKTPEFKKQVLAQASTAVGTKVDVKSMDIDVLSGVTLQGVAVANPAPFPGSLATAEEVVLRYRLRSLLAGRVEVQRLSVRKPVLLLAMDPKGTFNYEKLAGASAKTAPAAPAGGGMAGSMLRLVISRLAVENGEVLMVDDRKAPIMKVQDADLESAFTVGGGVAEGKGKAGLGTLALADMLFVRGVSSPLEMSKERVRLSPIRGKLAGGDVTGDLQLDLKKAAYAMSLDVKGAQVDTLLKESGSSRAVTGSLQAKASFEGTGGLPTLKGKGSAFVSSCRLTKSPVMALLAGVLQLPELANPSFDECRMEFSIGGNRVQTPVLSLKGAVVQMTGKGTMGLATSGLDYDMEMALSKALVDKIGVKELRAAFRDRGDGFSTIPFRVTGTTDHPQTDLATRIGKAAATQALKDQAGRLFGKKKPF
ncbi:MAG TPA: AsmA-like C-terminal region-containing protein [Vicinamibacteria bacterium]